MGEDVQSEPLLNQSDLGSTAWWQQVADRGTPLVSQRDAQHCELTFLWRELAINSSGNTTGQHHTQVFIDLYSKTPHPTDQLTTLQKIGHTDVWYWQVTVPHDWYGSYFLMPVTQQHAPPQPDQNGQHNPQKIRHWWINTMQQQAQADPFNRLPMHQGGWGIPLSQVQLAQAEVLAVWQRFDQGVCEKLQGNLIEQQWQSQLLGNQRRVWIYRSDDRRNDCSKGGNITRNDHTHPNQPPPDLPLVILLDGQYWAKQMPIFGPLDQLTQQQILPPAVYVLIDCIDPEHRSQELPCNAQFWQAVQQELLPQVFRQQPFTDNPQKTIVAGQSFGGLAAMYAGLLWPERFGAVLSQSGSFWWSDSHHRHPEVSEGKQSGWLTQQVLSQKNPDFPLRVFQEIGCYENSMLADNQQMNQALQDAGHQVFYREFRGGHDWICWRNGLLKGLMYLLNNQTHSLENKQ